MCVVWVFVLGGGLGWGWCGCRRAGEVAMELVWVFAPVTVSEIRDLQQLWFPCTMTSRRYGTRKPQLLPVTVGRNRNWFQSRYTGTDTGLCHGVSVTVFRNRAWCMSWFIGTVLDASHGFSKPPLGPVTVSANRCVVRQEFLLTIRVYPDDNPPKNERAWLQGCIKMNQEQRGLGPRPHDSKHTAGGRKPTTSTSRTAERCLFRRRGNQGARTSVRSCGRSCGTGSWMCGGPWLPPSRPSSCFSRQRAWPQRSWRCSVGPASTPPCRSSIHTGFCDGNGTKASCSANRTSATRRRRPP